MMFSPRNRRFSLLIIAASCVVLGTIAAIVAIEFSATSKDPAASQTRVIQTSAVLVGLLALLIKQENHERKASKGRHDIKGEVQTVALRQEEVAQESKKTREVVAEKLDAADRQTNGNLLAAVRQVAAEVRESERHQLIADPQFREALKPLLRELVREVCEERDAGRLSPATRPAGE